MIIQDNFLPQEEFNRLQEFALSHQFPWYYTSHVSLPPGEHNIKDPLAKETDGWSHIIFDREEGCKSFFYDMCDVFFQKLYTLGYTEKHLIRVRMSMKTPKLGHTEDHYNLPHVDYFYSHDTVIFYFNDSDGDTRMFEPFFKTFPEPKVFPTVDRISPKANRFVLFDGLQYHTASNPVNYTRRVILNINLDPLE